MDGNLNKLVLCCFCGESVSLKVAVILDIRINVNSEETQSLFAHKNHFFEKIHKTIPLHPDFFDT